MGFVWDRAKSEWLKENRGVSFEQISDLILEYRYLDIVAHPSRRGQRYFVIEIQSYTWLVPFVVDDQQRLVLKTAFRSRKYHRAYGGKTNEP